MRKLNVLATALPMASPLFAADPGGWGFEGFKGDSKTERAVGKNAAAACYQCHTAQKNSDYVFSAFRK
jgi:cytochrome c553